MEPLRIGMIGLGGIANMHERAIAGLENVELSAICTRSKENLDRKSRQWGVHKAYSDYTELLADTEIDAVVVAAPPNCHAPMTLAALQAGKHVLCEKPPALNSEQARQMLDCAKEYNRLLMYGLMFRFSEKHRFVGELCKEGVLGEIYYAKGSIVRRSDPHGGWFTQKAVSGGGPLMDYGPHIIDLAIGLMGEPEPESVYARTFAKTENLSDIRRHSGYLPADPGSAESDVEELSVLVVNFANGACLTVETSFMLHIKEDAMNLELFGTKGGMQVDPELEIYSVVNNHLVDMVPRVGCTEFEYQSSMNAQMRHFADCILHKTPCINSAENGVRLMKIIDAAYESARSGQLAYIVL